MKRRLPLLFAAPLCFACTGGSTALDLGSGGASPSLPDDPIAPPDITRRSPPPVVGSTVDCPMLGPTPLRRLSFFEYQATTKDLLGALKATDPVIARDPVIGGFENRAGLLNPSPLLVEQYRSAARASGIAVAESPSPVVPCVPQTAADERSCGGMFVAEFGAKVFRRPLTVGEMADYGKFFADVLASSDFKAAVQLTTEVFLQSPQFLYRLEFGDVTAAKPDRIKLTPFEMATRLSYLLWGSAPDKELFDAAIAGGLDTTDRRETQARRLMADPRATAMIVEFHRQWLDFDRLASEPKDQITFPAYTVDLMSAMREESDRFVAQVMGRAGDGTLKSLLTSPRTEANPALAGLYGVAVPSNNKWSAVDLNPTERAGLLTRANFLASRAHRFVGSPPLRGKYVLERFLCTTVPSHPANVQVEPVAIPGMGAKTNRQLFEESTASAACNGCHTLFDPLGYALENYDAIGRFRTIDNGLPVDARAHFQVADFDWQLTNGIDLSQKLADSPAAQTCMVRTWFEYALGRDLDPADGCRMPQLDRALRDAGGDIRELLVSLVKSPEFIYRTPVVP